MKEFMVATFTDLALRVALAVVLSGLIGVVGIVVDMAYWMVVWCSAVLNFLSAAKESILRHRYIFLSRRKVLRQGDSESGC